MYNIGKRQRHSSPVEEESRIIWTDDMVVIIAYYKCYCTLKVGCLTLVTSRMRLPPESKSLPQCLGNTNAGPTVVERARAKSVRSPPARRANLEATHSA